MLVYIQLLIITLAEASIGVFVKLTGGNVPIFTLNFYRALFAMLFLFFAVFIFSNNKFKFPKNNLKDIAIVGFLIAVQLSFFNYAMSVAPIANVVIFWSVAPFFVFIFSSIFLKEKPTIKHILIFVIALIGIIIAKPLSGGYAVGNIVALIDGAIYAAMVTYIRKEDMEETNNDIFWFMLFASIFLIPFLFIFGIGDLTKMIYYPTLGVSLPVILWVVCLGVISTGFAFFFISLVLRKIDANAYSLIDVIVSPIVAGILGYLIFTEIPSKYTVIGGIFLLLAGVWITREMQIPHSVANYPVAEKDK